MYKIGPEKFLISLVARKSNFGLESTFKLTMTSITALIIISVTAQLSLILFERSIAILSKFTLYFPDIWHDNSGKYLSGYSSGVYKYGNLEQALSECSDRPGESPFKINDNTMGI